MFSDSRPRESIFDYRQWWLDHRNTDKAGSGRPHELEKGQRSGKHLVAKLAGIDDIDAAEQLIGCTISVAQSELPALPKDEFYWRDLIGKSVVNRTGEQFGEIDRIIETGAHDVLAVRDGSGNETLIPWVMRHYVQSVDMDRGLIVVDWEVDWND